MSVNEAKYFVPLRTCMEGSVSLSCLFVHEPPYQTVVVCCNPVFLHSSSHMDHRTIFYVRVGPARAHPNHSSCYFNYVITMITPSGCFSHKKKVAVCHHWELHPHHYETVQWAHHQSHQEVCVHQNPEKIWLHCRFDWCKRRCECPHIVS